MKTNLKTQSSQRKFRFSIFGLIIGSMTISTINLDAQGLINNGAYIIISNGANTIVDGGLSTGNFTNQDIGASNGIVENTGVLSVSGNWINNSVQNVFIANTGMVTLNGTNQSIGGTSPTYFNNLTLLGSGTKSLNVNTLTGGGFAAPSGVLSLNSLPLDLNSFTLTINNPATSAITRTNGYIISETNSGFNPSMVQWNTASSTGNYIFPFGVSNTYIPLSVNKSTAVNSSLSASTRATPAADNLPWGSGVSHMYSPVIGGSGAIPVVIDRWWYINSSSPLTVDLSFTYRGSENTTTYAPAGNFGAQNFRGTWSPIAGSGPGVPIGTATVNTTAQSIGPVNNNWVLANILAPLPIELLTFEAVCSGKEGVKIKWSTASESDVDYFGVERSIDGNNFEIITTISSQGNSSTVRNYEYTDTSPLNATAFYRLKEHDVNGSETVFKTVTVKNCSDKDDQNYSSQIYSSGSTIYFNIGSGENGSCLIHVFDASGKLVKKELKSLQQGVNSFQLDYPQLAKGIYLVNCVNNSKVITQKLLLQ